VNAKYFGRNFLVEPMGFEPTASSMPSRRAPNCATAPPFYNITSTCDVPQIL
jgi:hypothetical protein